ncbi:unnamed protein product, partial [Amoebophrya sp. A120]
SLKKEDASTTSTSRGSTPGEAEAEAAEEDKDTDVKDEEDEERKKKEADISSTRRHFAMQPFARYGEAPQSECSSVCAYAGDYWNANSKNSAGALQDTAAFNCGGKLRNAVYKVPQNMAATVALYLQFDTAEFEEGYEYDHGLHGVEHGEQEHPQMAGGEQEQKVEVAGSSLSSSSPGGHEDAATTPTSSVGKTKNEKNRAGNKDEHRPAQELPRPRPIRIPSAANRLWYREVSKLVGRESNRRIRLPYSRASPQAKAIALQKFRQLAGRRMFLQCTRCDEDFATQHPFSNLRQNLDLQSDAISVRLEKKSGKAGESGRAEHDEKASRSRENENKNDQERGEDEEDLAVLQYSRSVLADEEENKAYNKAYLADTEVEHEEDRNQIRAGGVNEEAGGKKIVEDDNEHPHGEKVLAAEKVDVEHEHDEEDQHLQLHPRPFLSLDATIDAVRFGFFHFQWRNPADPRGGQEFSSPDGGGAYTML